MQPPHSSAVKLISRGSSSAVIYKDGSEKTIDNPADFPDPGGLLKVTQVMEPMIRATIVAPDE
jgi:translation elongation factor EF-4